MPNWKTAGRQKFLVDDRYRMRTARRRDALWLPVRRGLLDQNGRGMQAKQYGQEPLPQRRYAEANGLRSGIQPSCAA